jgi:hypothetical protein
LQQGGLTPDGFTAGLIKAWYRVAKSYRVRALLCVGVAMPARADRGAAASRRLRRWIEG